MFENPRLWEILDKVAEHGTMQKAADALNLSPSRVSAAITKLEKLVPFKLVVRRGPLGVEFTERGERCLDFYRRLRASTQHFEKTIVSLRDSASTEYSGPPDGTYRIAASTTTSEVLAPRWVGLLQRDPRVPNVELVSTRSASVIDRVKRGNCQVGFIASADDRSSLDTKHQLKSAQVGQDEIILVVGAAHRWAKRSEDSVGPISVSLAEFLEEPQVARQEGSGAWDVFLEVASSRLGMSRNDLEANIDVPQRVNNTTTLINSVIASRRLAALSSIAVIDRVASGDLREVRVTELGRIPRKRHAVWRGEPSAITQELVRIARQNSVFVPEDEGFGVPDITNTL